MIGRTPPRWVEVGDGGPLVRSRWIYNCYIVPRAGAGGPLAVDLGLPSHGAAVADWLRHAGHDLDETAFTVAATHLHSDHVGGIAALDASGRGLGPATVVLPRKGEDYVGGEIPRSPGPREVARIAPVLRSQPFSLRALVEAARTPPAGYGLKPFVMPTEHPVWIDDSTPVPGAPDWVAIVAPGHTDDSVVFYNASTRTMLSGDAVLTARGRAWFNPEYVDEARSAETEERLRALRVDVLLPGHGLPLVGRDLLATAVAHGDRPRRTHRR